MAKKPKGHFSGGVHAATSSCIVFQLEKVKEIEEMELKRNTSFVVALALVILSSCSVATRTSDSVTSSQGPTSNLETLEHEATTVDENGHNPEPESEVIVTEIGFLEGTWEVDDNFNKESLIFQEDGSFTLRINYCSGYVHASGNTTVEAGKLELEITDCADCDPDSRFIWPVITLALLSNGKMKFESDFYYFMDDSKLGACSPQKGFIFYKID